MINHDVERKSSGSALGKFLAKTLKQLRTQKGMSQEALAEKSGLDRTYISLLERNRKNVTLGTLEKIIPHIASDSVSFLKTFSDEIARESEAIHNSAGVSLKEPGAVFSDAFEPEQGVAASAVLVLRSLSQMAKSLREQLQATSREINEVARRIDDIIRTNEALSAAEVKKLKLLKAELEDSQRFLEFFPQKSYFMGREKRPVPVKLILENAVRLSGRGSNVAMKGDVMLRPFPEELMLTCHPGQICFAVASVINKILSGIPGKSIRAEVSVNQDKDRLHIQVTSTDVRMTDELCKRLFKPDFKAYADNVEHEGLGLCVAREIVEKNLGSLQVNPAETQTSFVFSFPTVVS